MCGGDAMPRAARERGFSLLEAVVALTIVSLAAVGALTAFAAELRAAQRARVAALLETLATEKLAESVLLPASSLRPLPDSLRDGRFDPPFEGFRWSRAIDALSGQPDLYQIAVEIDGEGGRLRLETRVYRPDRRVVGRP